MHHYLYHRRMSKIKILYCSIYKISILLISEDKIIVTLMKIHPMGDVTYLRLIFNSVSLSEVYGTVGPVHPRARGRYRQTDRTRNYSVTQYS